MECMGFLTNFRQIFCLIHSNCWFNEKHKNMLKYKKYLNYCIINWNICNFQQFLGTFLPHSLQAVGSMMSFLLEIMVPRHALSETHKNMLKY